MVLRRVNGVVGVRGYPSAAGAACAERPARRRALRMTALAEHRLAEHRLAEHRLAEHKTDTELESMPQYLHEVAIPTRDAVPLRPRRVGYRVPRRAVLGAGLGAA